MRVLFFNSIKNLEIIFFDDQKIINSYFKETLQASEEINDASSAVMKNFSTVEYLAVHVGPGSFVGTRVAITHTLGLRAALKVPIITVSTLEIIAHLLQKDNILIVDHLHKDFYAIQRFINGHGGEIAFQDIHNLKNFINNDEMIYGSCTINNISNLKYHKMPIVTDDILATIIEKISQKKYADKVEAVQMPYKI